jgi:hypothetical protein
MHHFLVPDARHGRSTAPALESRTQSGNPTLISLAKSVTATARLAALSRLIENTTSSTSIPISTNSVAFGMSSISSQNISRWRRVILDIANDNIGLNRILRMSRMNE